jgi:hypothetical protein
LQVSAYGGDPSFCVRFVADLFGMGDKNYAYHREEGEHFQNSPKQGAIKASSPKFQRSIAIYASNMTAVLDVEHRFVATASMPSPVMCCDAIMVVACSPGSICLKILGDTIEAGALNCHMASIQVIGRAKGSIEQDYSKSYSCTICTCLHLLIIVR